MDYFVVMFGITIFVSMHTFYCREIINDIALLKEIGIKAPKSGFEA
ncbi:MAG: hypothetical protein IPO64_17695 [Bacteroidetes bacterium]|nr:hypothetical protein [Bacteroidota bacterium]